MIYRNHKISIMIGSRMLELKDVSSLNLRLNNVIYDPVKISSQQAEYSFTFSIPITPQNNSIFDYTNILSKTNKFNKVYTAIVFADGNEIFRGQLKITSVEDNEYKCNLVSVKLNTIQDIFGESTMNEVVWRVPYDGMGTINTVNSNINTDYFFPLVCYGVFQKLPSATYSNEYSAYTSKYLLDKYVRWYPESFSPSVKLTELIKRMFQQKGYNVSGDIFEDEIANQIFLSANLADKQDPTYNLGNPVLGKCTVNWSWRNRKKVDISGGYVQFNLPSLSHSLSYPYEYVNGQNYDWTVADFWDMWQACAKYQNVQPGNRPNISALELSIDADNRYMWRDNCIVIPADGAYKITMEVNMDISEAEAMKGLKFNNTGEQTTVDIPHTWNDMPIEIHLLRNADEGELIHGYDGKITTIFPHEAENVSDTNTTGIRGGSGVSNTGNDSYTRPGRDDDNKGSSGKHNVGNRHPGAKATYVPDPSRGGTTTEGIDPITGEFITLSRASISYDTQDPDDYNMGFMPKQGELLCYDAWVNPNFICGMTTVSNCPAVIKNGYSWNPESTVFTHSRYNCQGYYGVNHEEDGFLWDRTSFNKNVLSGAPSDYVTDNGSFKKKGRVTCIVYLNKNDVLSMKAVGRHYEQEGGSTSGLRPGRYGDSSTLYADYPIKVDGTFTIEAYSPNASDIDASGLNYNDSSKFDTQLNLGNFMNKDTKQSEFVDNFMKAFNLSFSVDGKNVSFNKNYKYLNDVLVPVRLDDRVYNSDITILPIEYPKSMEIKYNINDEEAGFYDSVPYPQINYDDWKDYANIGSEKIILTQNEDAEETSVSLKNSYTWYHDFKVEQYDSNGNSSQLTISLPIIAKDEYMIENYKYEESMQIDGKGLPQRWWFRQSPNNNITFTTTNGEDFHPSIPINTKDGFNLNYFNTSNTLLTRYFNINAYVSSDIIEFETYLTPQEYIALKQGAPVRINSDMYYICSLTGYDASGYNTTKIRCMKKP